MCIFILFITTSLQKANDRYNDTAVVEAMVNDEEKNNEENKIPNEALLDDTQNPKPPQKEDIEPEKQ